MANFFVMLMFGLIGAFFGTVGFFIGIGIGIYCWISSNKKKMPPSTKVQEKPTTPVNFNNIPSGIPSGSTEPSLAQAQEYSFCLSHLYAFILSFYPKSDISKANEITESLKNDQFIMHKFGALDELARLLPQVQTERQDSLMLFQLHSNALIERILRLPKPMKARVAMQMDSFVYNLVETDPKDYKEHIEKVRHALRQDTPASSERLDAENFIARSGDPKANSILHEMRRNPSRYKELLRSGASGNTVLKTAFGVFAGMLAADAVRAAVTDYQKENLLTQLDQNIEKAGGLDNISLQDEELDSLTNINFNEDSLSGFGDEMAESNYEFDLPEESHTNEIEFGDNSSKTIVDDVDEADADVPDGSNDVTFDFDD